MQRNHHSVSSGFFAEIEPPNRLTDTVLARVNKERKHTARIRFVYQGIGFLVSLGATSGALVYVVGEFASTGFYQYFSLFLSDRLAVLSIWRELSLVLADSVPFFAITIFISTVFVLLSSLKFSIHSFREARLLV